MAGEDRAVAAEKIRIVFGASPRAMRYSAVGAIAVTAFLWLRNLGPQDLLLIKLWAVAMVILNVYPYWIAVRFKVRGDDQMEDMARQLRKFDFWAGWLLGSCWGMTSWLFMSPHDTERNTFLFVLNDVIVMGFASVAGVHRRHFMAFLLPLVLVFVAGLLWAGSPSFYWLAFLGAVLGVSVVDMSRSQAESVEKSIRFGIERQALLGIAESASRAKTRFLASASHDLRQPIHTLALFVEALYLRPLDDPTRALAGHMRTATQALSTQLDALLDISKLDAGVVQVNASAVPLDPLLTRLRNEYQAAAQRKGLTLTCEGDARACVRADPMHLERILRNLVDNAIKYTEHGGVTMSATRQGGDWALAVRDTGCGIAVHDQARVFEEFFQVGNPHRDRTLGMGLGLSIVARLAELLGIAIDLQSEPGLGSTFTLCLAAADQQAQDTQVTQLDHASLVGLKVLVIDDEQSVRLAMQSLLEGLGCCVRLASGLNEALADGSLHPDIALVDFRLAHGEDGISTIARLRAHFSGLPAILISGDVAPERLRQASEAGLVLLHKPVPLARLVEAIRAIRARG